jgi:hypothetical protein
MILVADVLSYRPTMDELVILDENKIRWTDFCRKNIANLKNDTKTEVMDKLILRALLIALGGIIFAFSPLLNDIVLIMIEIMIGIALVFIGTLSILILWRDTYKQRRIL